MTPFYRAIFPVCGDECTLDGGIIFAAPALLPDCWQADLISLDGTRAPAAALLLHQAGREGRLLEIVKIVQITKRGLIFMSAFPSYQSVPRGSGVLVVKTYYFCRPRLESFLFCLNPANLLTPLFINNEWQCSNQIIRLITG